MVPSLPFSETALDAIYLIDVITNTWMGALAVFLATIIGALLAGKQESDAAKAGTGPADRENITWMDWAEDAAYGIVAIPICLITIQLIPTIPILTMPIFGFAGRKLLMAWALKVENTIKTPPQK